MFLMAFLYYLKIFIYIKANLCYFKGNRFCIGLRGTERRKRMLIRLVDEDERDLYIQLADEIMRLIASKQLEEGDELPSMRKLASSLNVNVKTVQAAYQKLADEGFILQRKKATSIVNTGNFNEQKWIDRWSQVFKRFENECKARNLSEEEINESINQLLKKERR